MIVSIGDIIINLNHIRQVERAAPKPPGNLARARVTWDDGSVTLLDASFDALESHCGRVVPAPAGYQVIGSYKENEQVGSLSPVPIIAFRITGAGFYDVVPSLSRASPMRLLTVSYFPTVASSTTRAAFTATKMNGSAG